MKIRRNGELILMSIGPLKSGLSGFGFSGFISSVGFELVQVYLGLSKYGSG